MNIYEYVEEVKKGNVDLDNETAKVMEKVNKINEEYNYLNVVEKQHSGETTGKLSGVFVSVKDSICVKGMESSAGSRILKGYRPLFDATAVGKIKENGAVIIGKTSQDAFGFGSFSANVGLGFRVPLNPFDKERCCGGSSGGSAGITRKADFPHISLGESTGGSIAAPGAFCGVYALCPTYGRISRYGLIDYGNSLDKIGPMGREIEDIALALEVMSGYDEKDSTSADNEVDDYKSYLDKDVRGMRVGVIKEAFGEGVDESIRKNAEDAVSRLEGEGVKVKEVSLPLSLNYGLYAYYIIAPSEASTNLAKLCGMRYGAEEEIKGNFNEYFSSVRSKHFGDEAKRRIIIGTFTRMAGYRDAYYIKAAKVRTMIIEEYKKAFKDIDALLTPTMPILPPRFKEIEKLTVMQNYMMDLLTCAPNLAGLPHINVPFGESRGLPIGVMLTADHMKEGKLLQLSKELK